MMKFLFIVLNTLITLSAYAQLDLQVGSQARSLPMIGGEVFAEAGYGQLLWGEGPGPERKNPFYGFVRPSLAASSSVVINAVKAELEVFPISFFGFSAGYQKVESNFDFPFFDCDRIFCQMQLERRWIEGRLALGHAGWLFVSTYREDHIDPSRDGRPFGDFRRVVIGKDGGDQLREARFVFAKSWNKQMLGVVHEWSMFQLSRQDSRTTFAVYQINMDKHTLMGGFGSMESDQQGRGPVIYLRWVYQILPTIKLI